MYTCGYARDLLPHCWPELPHTKQIWFTICWAEFICMEYYESNRMVNLILNVKFHFFKLRHFRLMVNSVSWWQNISSQARKCSSNGQTKQSKIYDKPLSRYYLLYSLWFRISAPCISKIVQRTMPSLNICVLVLAEWEKILAELKCPNYKTNVGEESANKKLPSSRIVEMSPSIR